MTTSEMIERELLAFRNLCSTLNIPEYVETITDEEIILLALNQLEIHVEKNQEDIWEAINVE